MYQLANAVRCRLAADASSGATELEISKPNAPWSGPPEPGSDGSVLTLLDDPSLPSKLEVITYTGYTDNDDGTVTLSGVEKGAEGTPDHSWDAGSYCVQSVTDQTLVEVAEEAYKLSALVDWAIQQGQLNGKAVERLRSGGAFQSGTADFDSVSDDFRSDFVSVSLSPAMPTTDYRVLVEPDDDTDPERLGQIVPYDRTLNGFKIRVTGSGGGTVRWAVLDPRSI